MSTSSGWRSSAASATSVTCAANAGSERTRAARIRKSRILLLAPEPEFLHLHLQALARDLQQLGGPGDVVAGHLQPADDQVALDGLHLPADDLLERPRRGGGRE